jgi:hypothetical protein
VLSVNWVLPLKVGADTPCVTDFDEVRVTQKVLEQPKNNQKTFMELRKD